jgi:hypothetical protein
VQDLLIQHHFKKLHKQKKVKGITLKNELLRWKQSQIYVLAKLFFDMWVMHHGMLQFIRSHKDAKFMMGFWKHLF